VHGPLFIRVAVPVPQLDLLTYQVPDAVPSPHVGARVVVPLGPRVVTGIVVDRGVEPPEAIKAADIKPIRRLLDEQAFIPQAVVELATWTAEYYTPQVRAT
jgi:primosomal protein N' (replication factor Y) (superfamily II helicase)